MFTYQILCGYSKNPDQIFKFIEKNKIAKPKLKLAQVTKNIYLKLFRKQLSAAHTKYQYRRVTASTKSDFPYAECPPKCMNIFSSKKQACATKNCPFQFQPEPFNYENRLIRTKLDKSLYSGRGFSLSANPSNAINYN